MALPQQLMTARMTDATLGKYIDDKVGELEAALADILGFTTNVNITESPFSCDNSGRITKALVRLAAAAPMGIRFRDTTNSKEFRLALSNTSIMLDENTGSEGTPTWTNRLSIALGTGLITLAAATDPSAANDLARKGYVDTAIDTDVATHAGAATSHAAATNLIHATGNETLGGTKTFSTIPVLPASDPTTDNQAVRKAFVDAHTGGASVHTGATNLVHASGDETVAGIKTFSSIPVGPASNPTTDNQLARKAYVDTKAHVPVVVLTHTLSSGTNSGGPSSGSWVTRTLNTEKVDTDNICTLSSSQFTLPAGTYELRGAFPFWATGIAQTRLYNVDDTTVVCYGTNTAGISGGTTTLGHSILDYSFTLSAQKTLRIENRVQTSNGTNGYGPAASFGVEETYAVVVIRKVG